MSELSTDELRILRLCADPAVHEGVEADWEAFNQLVRRGLIAKQEDGEAYWPTPLGEQALKAAAS